MLVLDEPTNDLDLATLRALEEAIMAFPGAVIIVSHDRWFLDRVATRILYLDGEGGMRQHHGVLSDLLAKVARSARAHGTDPQAGAAAVDALIAEFLGAGLLDDARYADDRALALFRRGTSARAIRGALLAKGVASELIEPALERLSGEAAEAVRDIGLAAERAADLCRQLLTCARPGPLESQALDVSELARETGSLMPPPEGDNIPQAGVLAPTTL